MRVLGLGLLMSGVMTGVAMTGLGVLGPAAAQEPGRVSPASSAASAEERPAPESDRAPAADVAARAAPAASPAKPVSPRAPAAAATAPAPSGPTVMLVMESSGGLRAASELRQALHQVGYRVLSPAEVQRKGQSADALLTVAFTPPADTGARSVHVTYWGRDGRADSLTAASLATADQLNAVALALSSALIDRHKRDAPGLAMDLMARARLFEDVRAPGLLYAMVTNAPRTNVRLRFEDF